GNDVFWAKSVRLSHGPISCRAFCPSEPLRSAGRWLHSPRFSNELAFGVPRLWFGMRVALSAAPVTRRDETMDGIRKQLEQDLRAAVARLRQLGGATALEDLLGPRGEHWSFADEV